MNAFLDRLMLAESGGRDDARNPRSTAVGPFQFIERTFLEICRRHFAEETQALTPVQVLALRSHRPFARRAAEAFTRDNAGVLAGNGIATTAENLRLAFLLGAEGAVRVLKADPGLPVISIVGALVVQANPFMAGMTVQDLAGWAVRNLAAGEPGRIIEARGGANVALAALAPPSRPAIVPPCRLELPSCRKWLVLAERRAQKKVAQSSPSPRRGRLP